MTPEPHSRPRHVQVPFVMAPSVGIYTPFITVFLAAGYFGLDQVHMHQAQKPHTHPRRCTQVQHIRPRTSTSGARSQVGAELECPFGVDENNLALLAIGSELCKSLDTLFRTVAREVKTEKERLERDMERNSEYSDGESRVGREGGAPLLPFPPFPPSSLER